MYLELCILLCLTGILQIVYAVYARTQALAPWRTLVPGFGGALCMGAGIGLTVLLVSGRLALPLV